VKYRVIFTAESKENLRELRRYIFLESKSRRIARNYTNRLTAACRDLSVAPHRGEARVRSEPGFRTIGFEGRVTIVFQVEDDLKVVNIISLHYGGRSIAGADYEQFE